jgi:hemoglobin
MRISTFDQVGGMPTLVRVHRRFYAKVFAHPWLRQYFQHVARDRLESQQSDFMAAALGGPDRYAGMMPKHAHRHMYITEELFAVRHELLRQALVECQVSRDGAEKWLKIDAAFGRSLIKRSRTECVQRYSTEPILDFAG